MTTFPGSPRLINGAIVGLDPFSPCPSVIIFQYNPDTVTRTVTAQTSGDNPDQGEALRLKGPPQETIKLDVEIDAADQLEKAVPPTTTLGLYPALAALELLLYPPSKRMIANEVLAKCRHHRSHPARSAADRCCLGQETGPARAPDPVHHHRGSLRSPAESYPRQSQSRPARADLSGSGAGERGGALYMAHQVAKESDGNDGRFRELKRPAGTSIGI